MTKARSNATAPNAKGTLVVGNGTDASTTLAVASTAGYVLTVDSAEATGLKWATPSAGALTLITQASFNNPNVSVSNCFSTTYENYLILINAYVSGSASQGRPSYWRWLDSGGNELSGNQYCGINFGYGPASTATLRQVDSNFVAQWNLPDISNRSEYSNLFALNVYRNASSNGIGPAVTGTCFVPQDINQRNFVLGHYLDNASTGVYGFKFYNGTYNLVGNYRVYGYQKS